MRCGVATVEHARRRFLCRRAEDALARHGRPEIFNTDQGSQFTSDGFTGTLKAHGVTISMDGKGRCMDNIFVERLWRSLKYEEVYLHAYATVAEAKAGIAAWTASTMPSATPEPRLSHTATIYEERCGYVDDRLRRPATLPHLPSELGKQNTRLRPHTTGTTAGKGIDIDNSEN